MHIFALINKIIMQIIITSKDFRDEKLTTIKRYIQEAIAKHSVLKDFDIQIKMIPKQL